MTTATDTKLHGEVQLGHICSYRVTVGAPEVIGPLAEGLRLNFYVTGGDIFGPKMRGRLGHKDSAQQPLPEAGGNRASGIRTSGTPRVHAAIHREGLHRTIE